MPHEKNDQSRVGGQPVSEGRPTASSNEAPPTTPRRIQRKRVKGWRMPSGAFYVGRPTRFGNPFQIEHGRTPADVVDMYRRWLPQQSWLMRDVRNSLRGKDLACWCRLGQPCHADVLLELAALSQFGGWSGMARY